MPGRDDPAARRGPPLLTAVRNAAAPCPDDPVFQMVFPQSEMLRAEDERRLAPLVAVPGVQHEYRETVLYSPSRVGTLSCF
ncbi:hypothetical protein [Streptomyces sp. NPDC051577]|uniref:hypothetical protein n=1 Tax=Streptomyces sp. NPDC051577 TaxID=3155166 RepID=UPI003425AA0B